MRTSNYIVFICFTALLAGCKKNELPAPVKEDPKIWVQFNVNGSEYKFTSGVNSTTVNAHSKILNSKRDFVFHIDAPELKRGLKITVFNVPQNVINQSFDNIETELDRTIIPGAYNYCYNDGSVYWQPKQGDIAVEYIDMEHNENYQSMPASQLSFSRFEVISVTDTEFEGVQYKLAEIKFNCLLKCHATGGYYKISNGMGVVVFGQ